MTTILLVEDEVYVQRFIIETLRDHRVTVAESATAALGMLTKTPFDLVLVDLILGAEDGIRVVREVRRCWPHTPIVILTGHGSLASAIQAIQLKVSAYLLKPVKPVELCSVVASAIADGQAARQQDELALHMARALEAYMRDQNATLPTSLTSGALTMNFSRYEARFQGRMLPLSTYQFLVLWVLVRAAGQPVATADIAREALGYELSEAEARELVKGYIAHIRRKLAEIDPLREYIRTIRGSGYLWVG